MFDTMTLTKIVGSVCGALLVYLLGNLAAESLYSMGGGHGDHHEQGYVIDTGSDDHGAEVVEEGPSLAEMMASADAGKGEKVFSKCKACHKVAEGENATGPYLYGVVGRPVASVADFGSYSDALKGLGGDWTPETLFAFLESPKAYAPGTGMAFSGLSKPGDRANLIMYLDQLDGDVYEMAVPKDEAAAEPSEEAAVEEASAADVVEEAAQDGADAAEEVAADVTEAAEEAAGDATEAAADVAEQATEAVESATEGAVETAEAATEEVAGAAAGGGSDFAAMVAAADPGAGEKVFRRCKSCHKVEDGARGVGPHLYGIVGRAVASVEGFKYSDAVKGLGGEWTVDRLGEWLADPKAYAPGTKMSFSGLRDAEDRAALIAFLGSSGG